MIEEYTIEEELEQEQLKREAYHKDRRKRQTFYVLMLIWDGLLQIIGIIASFAVTIIVSLMFSASVLVLCSGFIIGLVKLIKFAWGT